MPFNLPSRTEARLLHTLRRCRKNIYVAYGVAIVGTALAVLLRIAIGRLDTSAPFITFYPAIVFITVIAGFGPGVLAGLLSSLAAWYFFLPPYWSWNVEGNTVVVLANFAFINVINVVVVSILNRVMERGLEREEEVRALIETAPNGIVVVDEKGRIKLVNATAEKLFGYTRLELIGEKVEVVVPDRLAIAHETLRGAYLKAPETRAMGKGRDLSGRRKDGSEFPVEVGLSPITRDGRTVVLATVIDISERKKAADRQRLLNEELRHRTGNLFAVIQGLVRSSFDGKRSSAEARDMLLGRMQSLSHTTAMLAGAAWEGAPLDRIVQAELAAFTDRAEVEGCEILVSPSAAQSLALILHELATNASKYGALSVPSGRIAIRGRISNNGASRDVFLFQWRESGGPPVAEPKRRGFGSAILLDTAKAFGEVKLDYTYDGIQYNLMMPLNAIQPKAASGQSDGSTHHVA